MKNQPPRLAQRFFSWYCRNHLHDSILGDLDEQFYQNTKRYSAGKAKFLYWIAVFRFLNRFTLKRSHHSQSRLYNSSNMLKTNLIGSFRFFQRNKGYGFINILGLTLGLSSFLIILIFVKHERSFDEFHPNKSSVYRVNFSYQDRAGNLTSLVNSPPALAPGIAGKFPEVTKMSRMRYAMNCLFTNGDIRFYEDHGYYADSLFLETLHFELSSGDESTVLDEPNSIVISEKMALKYFNDANPVGSILIFNNDIPLKVTGVMADIPTNSHLDFNFLISFSTYQIPEGYSSDLNSWSWLGFLTYLELKPNSDPTLFNDKLARYFAELNPDNPRPLLPVVQNLSDIYLGSNDLTDDLASHIRMGDQFIVNALMLVAILILMIAGFNFSNLTSALAITRSKSTGIRKVLGAHRKNIISLIITESVALTFLCVLLSFGIAFLIFPAISNYMNWEIDLGLEELMTLLPLMLIVGFAISICSGLYPALTLSKFDIIKSLKGSLKIGPRNPFKASNVLVVIQFTISIGLIVTTIIMTQQISFLRDQEPGYRAENVVLVKMLPEDMTRYYDLYKKRMSQHSSVISLSRSERVLGDPWPFSSIRKVSEDPEMSKRVFFNLADYDYFKTMDIPMIRGRSFSEEFPNDPTRSIIINRQAMEYLGLENPVGEQVHFFELDGPRTIIGVVEDFNFASLHHQIDPAVMVLPFIDLEFMYIRFAPGDLGDHIRMMEKTWQEVAMTTPLEWKFLDENLDLLYQSEEKLSFLIQVFTVLAILLASLGLLGIITYMVNRRIKEVGIRKVMGAPIASLYGMFIRRYLFQIMVAMVTGIPVIHYLLGSWLNGFAYHIKINWIVYPLSSLLLAAMIFITITYQILKAARMNPTLLLRNE